MNRLDLIIDALEKAKDGWQSFDEYEKALAAARELRDAQWGNPKYLIEEAVLVEREACAKLCEDWLVGRDDICEVAKAIRQRGEK